MKNNFINTIKIKVAYILICAIFFNIILSSCSINEKNFSSISDTSFISSESNIFSKSDNSDETNIEIESNIKYKEETKIIADYSTFSCPYIVDNEFIEFDIKHKFNVSEENLYLQKCKIATFSIFLDKLNYFNNLKYIDLTDCNLSNEEIFSIKEVFPNINVVWEVSLGQWKVRTDAIGFTTNLVLGEYVKLLTSDDLYNLKYCSSLIGLDLGHHLIGDISPICDNLPNLKVLILAGNQIKDISPIKKLKHLKYLELFKNDIVDLQPLKELNELVDLNICYNLNLENIEPILNLPNIERLWIGHCKFSDEAIKSAYDSYPNATIALDGEGSTYYGWREHPRYFAMRELLIFNKDSDLFK
ncbi:MAG: leucine-rich repeat domain-containing protein [Eubacteriales bacterium]|nr:leucine-rich repeat domain-containing protein [Eubacteriales bacterium]